MGTHFSKNYIKNIIKYSLNLGEEHSISLTFNFTFSIILGLLILKKMISMVTVNPLVGSYTDMSTARR